MRHRFAITSNVEKFLGGVQVVDERGASEASMLLVTGDPGYGKTSTVQWWAAQHGAVYLRAKASYTPHWMLTELVRELGHAPARRSEDLFAQAMGVLARDPRPLVIDEVEHALHDSRVLESVRDLTDMTEVTTVLVGMEHVQAKIARFAQISSRIAAVVHFSAATVEDVRVCCDTVCEVGVADDLVAEIHRQAAGRLREVMNAIAQVERVGKASGAKLVELSMIGKQRLVHDWQRRASVTVRGRV
ncbi:ATP-binding protein [Thiofaba sp. EF100]|uniref:ATP-binding protein n=1 Tax=Thiofaba sp. EF100 TaxID=3121274 RepID=UPI00322204A4